MSMSSTQAHQNDPTMGIADAHGEVCLLDPDRVRYWAKVLDVTEAQLRHALNMVGMQWDRSEAVSAKLNKYLFIRRYDPHDTPGRCDT
jgi:hypothetical protein